MGVKGVVMKWRCGASVMELLTKGVEVIEKYRLGVSKD